MFDIWRTLSSSVGFGKKWIVCSKLYLFEFPKDKRTSQSEHIKQVDPLFLKKKQNADVKLLPIIK